MHLNNIFKSASVISHIPAEEYERNEMLFNAIRTYIGRDSQTAFVIDFYEGRFVGVSKSFGQMIRQDECNPDSLDCDEYFASLLSDDKKRLSNFLKKGLEQIREMPSDKRIGYTLSYEHYIACNGRKDLVHHKMVPLLLDSHGHIWLALCIITASSHKRPGHLILRNTGENTYKEFNQQTQAWVEKPMPVLTDLEQRVLCLSARGFTMDEIAIETFKALDTIKSCKAKMFKRMDVTSISMALVYASNWDLI